MILNEFDYMLHCRPRGEEYVRIGEPCLDNYNPVKIDKYYRYKSQGGSYFFKRLEFNLFENLKNDFKAYEFNSRVLV